MLPDLRLRNEELGDFCAKWTGEQATRLEEGSELFQCLLELGVVDIHVGHPVLVDLVLHACRWPKHKATAKPLEHLEV